MPGHEKGGGGAVTRFTLGNGLRVIVDYDPGAAMAAVNVAYNVGSRDEQRSLTGLAHLFEHLMFGGSVNEPDFDGEIERAGGTDNAWTSSDHTNFYDLVPAVNVETALRLESDRMLSPLLSERSLDVQRSVVVEEFKQVCLNQPYGDMGHHLRALAFDSHPYSWPTIGLTPEHVESVTREQAEEFFFTHYSPSRAVLCISGNVHPERARKLVEKWFGPLPRRTTASRQLPRLGPVEGPRELTVTGHGAQTALTVAFRMPGYMEPGYVECDLITDVLASGRASRLFKSLVAKDPLFTSADAVILGTDEPGLLMLNARLDTVDDRVIADARSRLLESAMQLCAQAPSEGELVRAQNRYESQATFAMLQPRSRAQIFAVGELQGVNPLSLPALYREVTPERLRTVAQSVIDPSRAITLIYKPA